MDTINIPKQEYDELLKKAEQLAEIKNQEDSQDIQEVNEDDFDNLEVMPEYLEKLERIRKEGNYSKVFHSIEELDEHIRSNA